MNVDELVAVDVHVHVEADAKGRMSLPDELMAGSAKYFKTEERTATVPQIAEYYRERRMAAVVFTVDSQTATGHPAISSEEIAEACADHTDVLIPFGSVDPWRGKAAVKQARTLIEKYGVRGFKFHPSVQAFHPNNPFVYPLYEVLAEHRAIALFHTGQTGIGAGVRGGGGIRLKYANPMVVDDVAAGFPDMPIILAHPSFPWQDEALAVATHKPQVYIDLSGWSPKYFPPQLVQYANTLLKDKVLFGSDFPVITPDRWLADFDKLDIRPEVRPMILKDNAVRLFGLGESRA
jgi:predicted TIM-barrel fold metal-dependent hydrolase